MVSACTLSGGASIPAVCAGKGNPDNVQIVIFDRTFGSCFMDDILRNFNIGHKYKQIIGININIL